MIPIKIDEEKCSACDLCAGDCPNRCLCVKGGKARARGGAVHCVRALLRHLPARGGER